MSEERLNRLIEDFNYRNLSLFFRSKCENYAEAPVDLSQYNDDRFKDFQKLGEIRFDSGDKLVITSSLVSGDLGERSGKKAQYEKAKKILKELAVYDAGFFIFHDDAGSFRFSLVYAQFQGVKRTFSNFRRFTYLVSKDQTNKTFRIRVGGYSFSSLEAVKDAFSVEKVNKEFYNHIARFFYRLTGYECKREMNLPSVSDDDKETYQEFAVRLIGRTIFCWFLKHKKSAKGVSLIPGTILSSEAVKQNSQYYHSTLEKLFFEVLNTPQEQRHKNIMPDADKIPFLNGGLFEPHKGDFYSGKPLYNLVIPDAWFEQFFEILEQYNFTIDENSTVDADVSVDPEMLGRIFENLLAEVNPETGESARKATGSYYTPRTIVDYMVDQSLKQYLITKTKIDEDRIAALLSYEAPEVTLGESEKGSIISALDDIKIIDPACGSGAFPMGILHKMLLVLQKIDPDLGIWLRNHLGRVEPGLFRDNLLERIRNENWEYVRKLLIIQKSIYGVDIQTIAVEISKLRFFLSLIVDEQIDDLKENRGVEALPNLEFKFVAANSIIGLPPMFDRQMDLGFGAAEKIDKLKELRNQYLRSYGKEKEKIEGEFLRIRGELIEHNIKTRGKDTFTLQLASWNPFSNEKSDWFDPDWMFGIENEFDIVIANPPYLGESGHKEIFRYTKQGTLKDFYQGKMDIFYFFFHLALNIGTNDGQVAFITTNYYPTATGAKKLRQDLKSRTSIQQLINFNELKIFESAQGQHNMITILSKRYDDNINALTCATERDGIATPQILQSILSWQDEQTRYYLVTQKDLYESQEYYIRLTGAGKTESNHLQILLYKIKSLGQPLDTFCMINQGVVSGCDYVSSRNMMKLENKSNIQSGDGIFVFDLEHEEDREVIKSFSDKERKLLKPFFKNTDTKPYWCKLKANKYLLYLDRHYSAIDQYPNIKKHLDKFYPILVDRREVQTKRIKYFQLQWPRVESIFTGPKITVPYRSEINSFAYNESEWFCRSDSYVITSKDSGVELKYILALLNSKLYYVWLYHKGKRKGETLELFQVPLSEIPIQKISKTDQNPFISIVDKILSITKDEDCPNSPNKQALVEEYERQIDKMVYELYGLTPEEIAVVEGSTKND
jgi:adenine-specific DNA-methyltransferase